MTSPIVFFDIAGPDDQELRQFYSNVFGWEVTDLHLSTHLAHHLGQAGYLRRTLTGENVTSGAVSMEALTISGNSV